MDFNERLDYYGIYDRKNKNTYELMKPTMEDLFQRRAVIYDRIQTQIRANISTFGLWNRLLSLWQPTEDALKKDIETYKALNVEIKRKWPQYLACCENKKKNLDTMLNHTDVLRQLVREQLKYNPFISKLHQIQDYLNTKNTEIWVTITNHIEQDDYVTQQIVKKMVAMDPTLADPFPKKDTSASIDWPFFYHLATSVYNAVAQLASTATASGNYERLPTDLETELAQVNSSDPKITTNLAKYLVADSMHSCITTGNPSWYEVCEIAEKHRGWDAVSTSGGLYKKMSSELSLKDYFTPPFQKVPEPLKSISQFHQAIQNEMNKNPTPETLEVLQKIQKQLRTIPNSTWNTQDSNVPAMLTALSKLIGNIKNPNIVNTLNSCLTTLKTHLVTPANIKDNTIKELHTYVDQKKSELDDVLPISTYYQSRR